MAFFAIFEALSFDVMDFTMSFDGLKTLFNAAFDAAELAIGYLPIIEDGLRAIAFFTPFAASLSGALKPTPGCERFACMSFDFTELTASGLSGVAFIVSPAIAADWRRVAGF